MKDLIEVIHLTDPASDDVTAFLSRGHVDIEKFCEEIKSEFGEEDIEKSRVKHGLYRWVPESDHGGMMILHEASAPGRGVFKATVIEV